MSDDRSTMRREGLLVMVCAGGGAILVGLIVLLPLASWLGGWGESTPWTVKRLGAAPYLMALAGITWAGWKVWRGRSFAPILPRLLGAVGVFIALGGAMDTLGTPLLLRSLFPDEYSSIAVFDPTYLSIVAVGLLLVMVGRLTGQSFSKARELDEFV